MQLFDSDLRIENGVETVISSLTTGGSYFRQAGGEHNVCNGNDGMFSFTEVELIGSILAHCEAQDYGVGSLDAGLVILKLVKIHALQSVKEMIADKT